ncbi:MAG: hypothetical protein RIQ89_2081 [Bacteroidota bacterium]
MDLLMPLCYTPTIAQAIYMVPTQNITIEIFEHFIKQTCRNRCTIASANGKLHLSIPIEHHLLKSNPIKNVLIKSDTKWGIIHWRSIESAYNNSPFFEFYKPQLKVIFEKQPPMLIDWNITLFNWTLQKLKINSEINFTTTFAKLYPATIDLRVSNCNHFELQSYNQVFPTAKSDINQLSCFDLLFNLGNGARDYLIHQASRLIT